MALKNRDHPPVGGDTNPVIHLLRSGSLHKHVTLHTLSRPQSRVNKPPQVESRWGFCCFSPTVLICMDLHFHLSAFTTVGARDFPRQIGTIAGSLTLSLFGFVSMVRVLNYRLWMRRMSALATSSGGLRALQKTFALIPVFWYQIFMLFYPLIHNTKPIHFLGIHIVVQ